MVSPSFFRQLIGCLCGCTTGLTNVHGNASRLIPLMSRFAIGPSAECCGTTRRNFLRTRTICGHSCVLKRELCEIELLVVE